MTSVLSPWFVRPPRTDHAARVFCFPHAGAGASAFSAWPSAIKGVEICPVQLPGRENRLAEAHYGTYAELAAALVEPLRPHLDRPFAFFGHCAGALPAFETAVLLAELGLPTPESLIVSGQAPPHDDTRDRMLGMTESQLRAELTAVVRDRGIEPRPDMLDVGLSVLLQDLAAADAYRRAEPVLVPCPVIVVAWRDDPGVTLDQLNGWRRYSDSVNVHVVAGGHHDFMGAPDALRTLLAGWRSRP